jgi:pyroglutamyl-peptidase
MTMMRTLLTGFGAFGHTVNNPSARIVNHFARTEAPGHELTARVLPVSFARAEREIGELLCSGRFDAAVLLGVAGREEQLRLERFGRLRATDRMDVDGALRADVARAPEAPDCYRATAALERLLDELTMAGLPARLSDDAGDYVCNHTYYAALETISAGNLPTRCLFVHVPPDAETFAQPWDGPMLPLERQIEAVALILAWLAKPESVSGSGVEASDARS